VETWYLVHTSRELSCQNVAEALIITRLFAFPKTTSELPMSVSRQRNVLVLASGGADSSCCIGYYSRDPENCLSAMFVDYGQAAVRHEETAVTLICNFYKIPLTKIHVVGNTAFGAGVIRGRNALLLTTALTFCNFESGLIALGIHSGTEFPDCSPSFVDGVRTIFDIYSDGRIGVDAPFVYWAKRDIWQFGKNIGVPFDHTYSCDLGKVPNCGTCLSCKDRERINVES
jgi:7-cyano-7-deazaguanine synthase